MFKNLITGVIGIFCIATLVYGQFVPLNGDEALYWQHGRHLDWGFYTHPPMTGFLIWMTTSLLGDSLFGVRFASSILTSCVLLLVYRMAFDLTKDRRVSIFSVVVYLLFPMTFGLGVIMVTDVPLLFFHTCFVYFMRKALIDNRPSAWLAGGVAGGLMLQSKFLGVLSVPGLMLFVLSKRRYRRILSERNLYFGLLCALVVFMPFILWNVQNDWLNFKFQLSIRTREDVLTLRHLPEFLASYLGVYTPVMAITLVIYSLKILRDFLRETSPQNPKKDSLAMFAFVHLSVIGGYGLLALRHSIGSHWLASLQPLSAVLLSVYLFEAGKTLRRTRWTRFAWICSAVPVTCCLYVLLLWPKLLPDRFLYMDTIQSEQKLVANYYGWEKVGKRIDELFSEYEGNGRNLILSSKDYSLASTLSFYTSRKQDFALFNYENAMHGREYLDWNRPLIAKKADTLMVSDSPKTHQNLHTHYDLVLPVETLEIADDNGLLRVFYFHIGIGYKENRESSS